MWAEGRGINHRPGDGRGQQIFKKKCRAEFDSAYGSQSEGVIVSQEGHRR